ncbi:nitroreductase/quinone reductase family protein [Nocardia jiangsuensis]|uniref:Nitroreductase/quinone reductase family protein n=1 Tax=Nocardia jiangsuensis TaxID=1691563 RepID=A0ABV8E1B3_9NOCA
MVPTPSIPQLILAGTPGSFARAVFHERHPKPLTGIDASAPLETAELHGTTVTGQLDTLDRLDALDSRERRDQPLLARLWGNRADLGFQPTAAESVGAAGAQQRRAPAAGDVAVRNGRSRLTLEGGEGRSRPPPSACGPRGRTMIERAPTSPMSSSHPLEETAIEFIAYPPGCARLMRKASMDHDIVDPIPRRAACKHLHAANRRMYRSARPGTAARVLNRFAEFIFTAGVLSPGHAMTLEVAGRRTGRPVTLPIAVADHDGQRYLVSMLGQNAGWVRNVAAAHGHAALYRRGREAVQLTEVPAADRAPILRRYLAVAPGARPHFPVDRRAPLSEFERIASRYPVFRIDPLPR